MTYILDEPTAGLHPAETGRLLDVLQSLRDNGNTVIVVEHDEPMMRAADHLIDLGPGAGRARRPPPLQRAAGRDRRASRPARARPAIFSWATGASPSPPPARAGPGTVRSRSRRAAAQSEEDRRRIPARRVQRRDRRVGRRKIHARPARPGPAPPRAPVRPRPRRRRPARRRPDREGHRDRPGSRSAARRDPIRRPTPSSPTASATSSPRSPSRGTGAGTRADSRSTSRAAGAKRARAPGSSRSGCISWATWTSSVPICEGRRFNEETLDVRYRGRTISDVLEMSVDEAAAFFADRPVLERFLDAHGPPRPRLPQARAELDHALRRRGPAHQAGRPSSPGRRPATRSTSSRSRRRASIPTTSACSRLAPGAGRQGPDDRGHRAQPRFHQGGRLRHRSRAGKRRAKADASWPPGRPEDVAAVEDSLTGRAPAPGADGSLRPDARTVPPRPLPPAASRRIRLHGRVDPQSPRTSTSGSPSRA